VDTLEVLVSDPAKPKDDEVLDEDDRSDRTMSAFGHFDLPRDVCRGAHVGEGFRDIFLHRRQWGGVAEQNVCERRGDDASVCQAVRSFSSDSWVRSVR
jgi:hypothetical protein